MKKQRQNTDYKFQESKRKKEIIQNKSVEVKKMLHQVKKENMKQLRKKNNYKSKESTHKKGKIKNMSAEEKEKK